jgi:hypothetical protein
MNSKVIADHTFILLDAVVREAPNVQKAVNHACEILEEVGGGAREPGKPWIAVSIPPSREWSAAQGPMPVDLLNETAESIVDPAPATLLLVGPGVAQRVPLSNGTAHVEVTLSNTDPGHHNVLYAYNPETKVRGQSGTFAYTT